LIVAIPPITVLSINIVGRKERRKKRVRTEEESPRGVHRPMVPQIHSTIN